MNSELKAIKEILNRKRYIIFDFDETLFQIELDRKALRIETLNALKEFDKKLYQSLNIEEKNTPGLYQKVENIFVNKHGIRCKKIINEVSEKYETNKITGYKKNDPLINLIKKRRDKNKFFIRSSNHSKSIYKVLKREGIERYFSGVIGKNNVTLTKPFGDGFTIIQNKNKGHKRDYIMIGNSLENDIGGAQNAMIESYLIHPRSHSWSKILPL